MEYEEHVRETIKLIKEAIRNQNIDHSTEIRDRIKLYANDKNFGVFLMEHQQLAQDLLDALYNYVKIRHIELEEMLRGSLIKVFAPPSINKLLYLAAMQGLLTFSGFPNVLNFTMESMKSALEWVKYRKRVIKIPRMGPKTIKIRNEYLGELIEKRKRANEIRAALLDEIHRGYRVHVSNIFKMNGRHKSYQESRLRLIALVDLAVRGKVKLLYGKRNNLFIEKVDDSNGEGKR
ncbi:MAG: hypothetical protein ACP6IP_08550 [Candidatus Njordarchaeia archaeon]